jgi:hypothetical protein
MCEGHGEWGRDGVVAVAEFERSLIRERVGVLVGGGDLSPLPGLVVHGGRDPALTRWATV